MVTAGRARLAERSVRCFCQQTWSNRELIILDDGDEDYRAMLRQYEADAALYYLRIPREEGRTLGALRNLSLDQARGEYCIQWDDDEWHHRERIEAQMRAALAGGGASVLRHTLMHLDTVDFVEHPFRTGLRRGTPGTVLHRRSNLRYPDLARGEDSAYLGTIRAKMPLAVMDASFSYLFIRCFHGRNSWGQEHFADRLHYTVRDTLNYLYAKQIQRNIFMHPAFRLSEPEWASARAFLADSRRLGLCVH